MREAVLERYARGYSIRESAEYFGVNVNTAKHWLWRSGNGRLAAQTRRQHGLLFAHRKIDFNVNSPERAWFTGVVFGDGAVAHGCVHVTQGDNGVIDSLRRVVGVPDALLEHRALGVSQVAKYYSTDMSDYFMDLLHGGQKKGLQIHFPDCCRGQERFFWRGMIDTDGCVTPRKLSSGYGLRLRLDSISRRIIDDFEKYCATVVDGFTCKKVLSGGSSISKHVCYRYQLAHDEAVIVLDEIYRDSVGMRNERKFKRFDTLRHVPSVISG